MANAVRPGCRKCINSFLNSESTAFDEVTHDKVAGAVEAVVAVDTDDMVIAPAGFAGGAYFLVLADPVDQFDEVSNLGISRRDLRNRRELVVLDTLAEALRVVDRVVVADVDDILDDMSPDEPINKRSKSRGLRKG